MISLRKVSGILCLALCAAAANAQLRVATYNISNYDGTTRAADIQTLFYGSFDGRSFAPDVIVCQEFLSAAALNVFVGLLNTAPNSPGDWASATFVNGADTDSVFCYRTSKVHGVSVTTVALGSSATTNHPRNIQRYDFTLNGYTGEGATVSYYSTHMKAGSMPVDMDRRLIEAQRVRVNAASLPVGRSFMIGGDFNIQSSNETAYQELVGSQTNNDGRFFDPIIRPGSWYNSATYQMIHTQDPSGSGGMDDRFDQILLSSSLRDASGLDYIGSLTTPFDLSRWDDPNHSYRCWGNDGTTFNGTLRTTGNTNVGPVIAQALINAATTSGHLPVFLDLKAPGKIDVPSATISFGKVPQGFKPIARTFQVSNVADVNLWTLSGIASLDFTVTVPNGFIGPAGAQHALPNAPVTNTVWLDTRTPGWKQGVITITSNDPDQPVKTIQVTGYVYPRIGR